MQRRKIDKIQYGNGKYKYCRIQKYKFEKELKMLKNVTEKTSKKKVKYKCDYFKCYKEK